jgi:hypothetical protein
MKLIFLDIDGVLNSDRFFAEAQPARWGIGHIDPGAVGRVEELARRTGAHIVISSAWRHAYPVADLRVILRVAGLEARIVGATPDLDDGGPDGLVRAAEIRLARGSRAPRRARVRGARRALRHPRRPRGLRRARAAGRPNPLRGRPPRGARRACGGAPGKPDAATGRDG